MATTVRKIGEHRTGNGSLTLGSVARSNAAKTSKRVREPKDTTTVSPVVSQFREAFKAKNRTAALLGAFVGGLVPILSYGALHLEYDNTTSWYTQPSMWVVMCCLGFSLPKVYGWGKIAFGSWFTGICYALLMEAIMVCFHTAWLSLPALVILVGINAVSCSANFAIGK